MVAISRSKTKIYITAAGVDPADVASTDLVAGEIKSYTKSGGEKEVESDPVFGGYVDKEKPITQVEISMEVVPKVDENQDRWDAMTYGLDSTGVYTMAAGDHTTDPGDRAIFIEATDGTGYKSICFNNCNVTVLDLEHNADDNQTGNITFKFAPTNNDGVSNFQTLGTSLISMEDWTALDNN